MLTCRNFRARRNESAVKAAQRTVIEIFKEEGTFPVRARIACDAGQGLNGVLPILYSDLRHEILLERDPRLATDEFALSFH